VCIDGSPPTLTVKKNAHLQINGARVPKGQSRILRDGNEIAFGSPVPQQNSLEDYRYIYRHLASHELTGIHAHYDMAHELGRGTFATVMKAMSRETGEWFAVKIIHGNKVRPNSTNSPTSAAATATAAAGNGNGNDVAVQGSNHHQLQAFGREISILETLDHPNICRLRETFEPEGRDHDFCELGISDKKKPLCVYRLIFFLYRSRVGIGRRWRSFGLYPRERRVRRADLSTHHSSDVRRAFGTHPLSTLRFFLGSCR
jgi:Protein kinase domain